MFLFLSLLAASVDGFICGFLIGGAGIKFRRKEALQSRIIIFACCFFAALSGNFMSHIAAVYINFIGAVLMMYLAFAAVKSAKGKSRLGRTGVWAIAVSVAADASVVCMYLGACGYNILYISLISAFLHRILMSAGAVLSGAVITSRREKAAKYISARLFFALALYKIIDIKIF